MTWTLARYLFRRSVVGVAIALAVVAALLLLVDFVEATRNVDSNEVLSGLDLFRLSLLKLPSLVEQTLPFILLFAAIGTLNGLNRRSELIATRAAGVSAWRYLRPFVWVSLLFGLLWLLVVNPASGEALSLAAEKRAAAAVGDSADNSKRIWLRDVSDTRRAVIRADSYDPASRTLGDVTYLGFSRGTDGDTFMNRIDAKSATLLTTGYWQFGDLREWESGSYGPVQDALSVETSLTEREVLDRVESDAQERQNLLAVWELPALIRAQQRAGFSTIFTTMQFWKLLSLPVLLVAMTIIGATVSMRLSREGGAWRLVLTGGVLGFGVFFASVFVEAFGEVGTIPPLVATWTVPLVALALGLFALARLEDG